MFLGREHELSEFNDLYQQNRFHLFVLYGRRRVGKTTFLKEFCKDKPNIFYSVEQSNEKLNLDKFSALVFHYYGETTLEPFCSWENALLYIHNRQTDQPLVLVLDEFPYLAHINPAILSVLQHLVDHCLRDGKIFLVLCGSYMGFMEKEVLSAKSPLYGRRTGQLRMKPFDYKTSCRFLSGFSDEDKLLLYGALGGTAMYLTQIRPGQTVREAITSLFLKPTGYLYEEPLFLLRQEVYEPGIYHAVVEAIASGASRASDIVAKTGEDAPKCLKYIHTLCELGILHKEVPFGEKGNSRKTIYGISDPMFRFWYRYVAPNKTLLETDAPDIVWTRRIQPDLSDYMGHVFETVCRDYLLRENSAGRLPVLFGSIGRWWGSDPKTRSQMEIDLVAQDGSSYLFGECKWRNEKLGYQVFQKLKDKVTAFGRKPETVWYVLFSKSGFTDSVLQEAQKNRHLILITMAELMGNQSFLSENPRFPG